MDDWKRWSRNYDRGLRGAMLRPLYAKIFELSSPRSGERMLDVGSGPGIMVASALSNGIDAFGIDTSAAMAAAAEKRAQGRFVVAAAERLPFSNASFDLVTTSLSMHHWDAIERGLAEVGRVLRPRGRVLLADVEGRGLLQKVANAVRNHRGKYVLRHEIGPLLSSAGLTFVRQGVLKRRWVLTLATTGTDDRETSE
jgi:ubiquinone/menaquinone biosynthesis C-methylase UbiE